MGDNKQVPQGQKFVVETGLSSQLRARTLSAAVAIDCPSPLEMDFELKTYYKSGNTERKLVLACLRLPGFNILPVQFKKGQQDGGKGMAKITWELRGCEATTAPQSSCPRMQL